MKGFLISFLVASCFFSHAVFSQTDASGKSYYVVIGAFTYEKNAQDFIVWTKGLGLTPQYQINIPRKLFYVYTRKDNHWGIPVQEAERIRKLNPKLDETWVYYGTLDPLPEVEENESMSEPINQVVDSASVNTTNPSSESPVEVDHSKQFYFDLMADDSTEIKAPIELIDLDQSKLVSLYPSNEKTKIQPINESGRIMLQTKVFGYRLKQIGLDFNHPTDSAGIRLDSSTYHVPIQLKSLTVGDIAIMYNVFFFKDAAIMRPDSRYEVNSLVAMMQEFPNRRIVIHGHTNGTYSGKILIMGPAKDFFSQTGCVTTNGSAKYLSEERAKCIQQYLVANGIDASRMTIKAWGGKKMLFHHEHERAIENVRVEIEIAKD